MRNDKQFSTVVFAHLFVCYLPLFRKFVNVITFMGILLTMTMNFYRLNQTAILGIAQVDEQYSFRWRKCSFECHYNDETVDIVLKQKQIVSSDFTRFNSPTIKKNSSTSTSFLNQGTTS